MRWTTLCRRNCPTSSVTASPCHLPLIGEGYGVRPPLAPLPGELSAQLTERLLQICIEKTQTANLVCGLERKKRAQRIRSLACKDSFRRGRF